MNQSPYIMQQVAAIRYQEQLQQAEQDRLVRRLRDGRPGVVRSLCATVLLAAGAKLTRMGRHLSPVQRTQLAPIARRR